MLFGGVDAGGWELADTWEYDGSAWTQGPDCPVARGGHAMAFDSARGNFSPFNLGHGLALSAGDLDADGYAELATTPGPGPANPARVLGFEYDAASVSALPGADVTPFATAYGAATAIDAFLPDTAGREELVAGAGRDPSATSLVAPYRYLTALFPVGATFVPFPGGYGVNVALGRLGY